MRSFKSLCIFILVFVFLTGAVSCGGDKKNPSVSETARSTTENGAVQSYSEQTTTETTKAPVETTKAPTETTKAPVETTKAPAETTKAPVETTKAPAETTKAPAETTKPKETTAAATTYPENGLSKTDKVELKMAFFEGGVGKAWMEYAIKTFTEKFPNVSIKMTASPTIDKIIQTKISAANDEDMFDIFSTTRLIWEELADAGKLVEMDELWSRSPYDTPGKNVKDLFFDSSYKYQRFKRLDKSYSIDYGIDVMGLFYDKKLFKENGWNEQPKTYEEFIQLCDTIKAKNIYPMTFYKNYQWGLFRPKMFELALENGNTKFDYNFRNFVMPQYLSPECVEMWTRMYDMGKKKYFEPGSGTITHIISQMQVLQHKVAMVASGSWIQNEMKKSTPAGFEWGFMAMPFVSNANSKICVQQAAEDSLFVWAGKPELNRRWAKEFVLWMQNLDVQTEIAKAGMMSIRKDFSSDSSRVANVQGVCKEIMNLLSAGKIITVDISTRDKVLNDPNGYGDSAYGLMEDIRVAVALGKKDPAESLKQAEQLLQKGVDTGFK